MHACRCAANSCSDMESTGALAFLRDVFMDMPLVAGIVALQDNHQALVNKRLTKANQLRVKHDQKVAEEVV